MTPDERVDELLNRAHSAAAPSDAALARAFAGIEARLSAPAPFPAEPGPPAATALRRWPRLLPQAASAGDKLRLLGWGTLLAAVGFVLGLQVARAPAPAPAAPAAPVTTAPVMTAPPPTAAAATASRDTSAPPAPEPALTPPPLAAETTRPARGAAPRARPAPTAPRASSSRPSLGTPLEAGALSFEAALALLMRAERAERRAQPELALALLDELDARANAEVLREERRVTRILALCAQDDVAGARQLAARWNVLSASSVYASRLRESCVAAPDDGARHEDEMPPGARP